MSQNFESRVVNGKESNELYFHGYGGLVEQGLGHLLLQVVLISSIKPIFSGSLPLRENLQIAQKNAKMQN